MTIKNFPAQLLTTYNGSTVSPNSNVVSAISPTTNAQIFAALGYATKEALASAMIAAPEKTWAYNAKVRHIRLLGAVNNFD